MSKRRLVLAGLLALVAGAPRAALVTTINVTTLVDEDGENGAACSLREAVTAANTRVPYGGCPAGSAFDDNHIQLQTGTYQLTGGELVVSAELAILGNDSQKAAHDDQVNPLTGLAPRRFRPDYVDADGAIGATGTYIKASAGQRIFNTTGQLSLRDLVLIGSNSPLQASPAAVAGNGGVVFAGSSLGMDNVIVRGGAVTGSSVAAGNGGAIFLGGDGSGLTLTDVTLENNEASREGGAIAMLCRVNINPQVAHTVTITRSLLRANSAVAGAGAIQFCGETTATLQASTLSGNSSAADSGALAYVQGGNVGKGKLSLSYVTAAEQVGHVLAANGLASIGLQGSLLAAFNTAGATVCHNPDVAYYWMSAANPTGAYNAITADGSCTDLLSATGNNVSIPVGTSLSSVLVPIPAAGSYYPASPDGAPYGLSDYYLPRAAPGSPVLDRADVIANCSTADQRNTVRRSGGLCDIGAVERLQLEANDDKADSTADTDRLAIVDVLANDSFGEDDVTGPYKFASNAADNPATAANDPDPAVVVTGDGGMVNGHPRCTWLLADDSKYPGKLKVDNGGVITPSTSPIVCTYQVRDSQGSTSATTATVTVSIRNALPNAVDDQVLRPVGVTSVSFNPMDNDNDDGDGIYGHELLSSNPDVYGTKPDWAINPIEITSQPELGELRGATGLCPGSAINPKVCMTPPIEYVASNNLAPFSDSFSYRVYDKDGSASDSARVTIYTDAPDPDHGGGAGSFDLLGGLLLSLLGLRRFLRL